MRKSWIATGGDTLLSEGSKPQSVDWNANAAIERLVGIAAHLLGAYTAILSRIERGRLAGSIARAGTPESRTWSCAGCRVAGCDAATPAGPPVPTSELTPVHDVAVSSGGSAPGGVTLCDLPCQSNPGERTTALVVTHTQPVGPQWRLCAVWDRERSATPLERATLSRIARIIQRDLEFRDALRRIGVPFTEDPIARRRLQTGLAAFVQRALFVGTGYEVMAEGADLVAELMDAPIVQFFGSADRNGVLSLLAAHGIPPELTGKVRARPGSHSLAGFTIAARTAVTTEDCSRETRYRRSALLRDRGIQSSAAVPVWSPSDPTGPPTAVLAAHWHPTRRLRAVDVQFLQSVASVFASAEATRQARGELIGDLFPELEQPSIGPHLSHLALDSSFRVVSSPQRLTPEEVGSGEGQTRRILELGDLPLPSGQRDAMLQSLRHAEPWYGEIAGEREGQVRWSRVSALPASWGLSRPGFHHILVTDVTRRRLLAEWVLEAETRTRQQTGGAVIGVAVVDAEGRVRAANPEWRRRRVSLGCPVEIPAILEPAGGQRLCSSPMCESSGTDIARGFRDVLARKRPFLEEDYRCASAGQPRWYSVRIEPAGKNSDGTGYATIAEWDSTQARLADDELRRREARVQAVLHGTTEAFVTINHRGIVDSANPAAIRMFGAIGQDLIGRRFSQLLPANGEQGHDKVLGRLDGQDLSRLSGTERETHGRRLDGVIFPMTLLVSEAWIGRHPSYTAVLRDGSDRREAEELLEKLIYHDTVTRLPNRLLFRDRLDLAIQQGRRGPQQVGVLLIDVDRFGVINDSLGHYAGDRFLEMVARRLEEMVRTGDLLARWGGDEFNVLLPRIRGPEEAAGVAHRMREAIRSPFEIDGQAIYATISIGMAVYPRDGADADTLMRAADLSLHRAKRQGGDASLAFSPEMQRNTRQELSLDAELHRAADRGEFVVYYQPEVDLASSAVVGGECLLRWEHPRRGVLPPRAFLPLAEKTGLIVPIGMAVVRSACEQIARWQQQLSGPRRVAVNLSLRQLRHPGLLPEVETILRETGADPSWLDLEISESIAVSALASQRKVLRGLKSLGLRMSLDDFGQGYSSLKHLRRLPIETVKIDRSFVRRICRDRRDAAIVRAVIQIGHSLELRVVAEGVTRLEEVDFLRAEGCDTAQGFLYGHALPRAEFEERLLGPVAAPDAAAA